MRRAEDCPPYQRSGFDEAKSATKVTGFCDYDRMEYSKLGVDPDICPATTKIFMATQSCTR